MKKIIIVAIICLLVIVGAVYAGITINKKKEENISYMQNTEVTKVSEKVTDECTEEYEEMENEKLIETNSNKEKISVNCSLTLKKYYKQCGHTISEYKEIPEELINKTQEELEQEYENWKVEKFSSNEIILYREFDGKCGEHYVLRDKEGKIVIYQKLDTGEEIEYEKTEIATDYLTDTDKMNIKNGIEVNGKQNLNQVIEDFE